jgi:DNA-binding HxlR family transcriptional regulator
LRPEYVLTTSGETLAHACGPLVDRLRDNELEEVGLKKWSMPVVFALATGPRRFSELRERLEGISPRALTLALKDLEAAGLVDRRVTDDYPPATVYRLTKAGRPLAPLLRRVTSERQ